MLNKVPGIDPVTIHNVKGQTEKQIVHNTKELKITDKEKREQGREWRQAGKTKELEEFLEEINNELERDKKPILLTLGQDETGKRFVYIVDRSSQKVLQKVSLKRAGMLIGTALNKTGILLDDKG